MALRLRRGTDAERLLITPLQGEIIYATDTKKIYVGDGATEGGILVGPIDPTDTDLVNDTSPQLGGDLDLNSNNITGSGNINIDGTITATGSINLGDASEDEITVAGTINSSLRPALDSSYNLGSQARRWQNIFATGANIAGQVSVDSLRLSGNIEGTDSTVLYDANLDSLTVSTIDASSIDGDLTGSVFSDDSSSILVDSVLGQITGPVNNASVTTDQLALNGPLSGISINTEGTLDDDYSLMAIRAYHDQSTNSGQVFLRSRGSIASPATVNPGDGVFDTFYFAASSNLSPGLTSIIRGSADPNGTISNGVVPGKLTFITTNNAGSQIESLTLDKDGVVGVADNTVAAGGASGEVNLEDSSVASTFLKITVGSEEFAIPLYSLNP